MSGCHYPNFTGEEAEAVAQALQQTSAGFGIKSPILPLCPGVIKPHRETLLILLLLRWQ